ncbi:MAG: hypothetical protein KJ622_05860 [Alphaproteobacteria bacterium]|nr:hypothetical protein [Alphaproteobacteria bacterium]
MATSDEDDTFGPTTIRRASDALKAAERRLVEKRGGPTDETTRQGLARKILSLIRREGSPEKIADQAVKDLEGK